MLRALCSSGRGSGGTNPFQPLAVEIFAGGVDIFGAPFLSTSIKTLLASKEHNFWTFFIARADFYQDGLKYAEVLVEICVY